MSEKLSAEELTGAAVALAETNLAQPKDAGEWAAIAGTRGAIAKLYQLHITTLQREADGLREALERIANFAPGYGEAAEYIATMARHALYSELAEMAANERALATNEPPRSSDGEK